LVELMEDCRGFLVKDFTRRGRQDASGTSLQQHNAQPFLKLGDLLAQGWLRHMDDRGRTGKAAGLDNFNKIPELAKLHNGPARLRAAIIHRRSNLGKTPHLSRACASIRQKVPIARSENTLP
jgi:hypothetical protein